MKIVKVETWAEELALTRPYAIAYASFDRARMVFVRLTTDSGIQGEGCGTPVEDITGESFADSQGALAGLEDLLLGVDGRELGTSLRRLEKLRETPAARAAADIALHDLFARLLELPLCRVLGQAHRKLPTSITLGVQSVEETLREAREYLDRGFQVLKLKLRGEVEQDLETLLRLRELAGPDRRIRVDANQGFSAEDLDRFLARVAPADLEFLEQPLPKADLLAQRELPEEQRRASAADESLQGPQEALELAASPHPFGIFNIKLMKCGGIAPALEIARMAQLAGIDLMWGCMDESILSLSAALHAAFACPATRYLDLDGHFDLAEDPATGGFVLEKGQLALTDQPGLGARLRRDSP